jgi:ethanolamine utilization protein EutP (predicted NTPase)
MLLVRDRRVILDADLAVLYGVTTKALNQAVKRNKKRFPQDFMFRLSKKEKIEVVTNCDHQKVS